MKKKTCTKCKISKNISNFNRHKITKDGYRTWCKVCALEKQAYYRRTYPKAKQVMKNNHVKRRERNRIFIKKYLNAHPCVDCGDSRWQVLHFDHVKGQKLRNISHMVLRACSISLLKKEIKKCQVLCANCHLLKTAKQFGWFRFTDSIEDSLKTL
jgi:hypothetical protein